MQGSEMNNGDMVTESLGTLFRQMRKARNETLEDAAGATCINIRALRALEADDYSAIRAEVFVRGFIRNYAEHLGMDPKEAIAVYERSGLRPPQHDLAPPAEDEEEEDEPGGIGPAAWKKIAAAALVLAVIVYAGISLFSRNGEQGQRPAAPAAETRAGTPPPAAEPEKRPAPPAVEEKPGETAAAEVEKPAVTAGTAAAARPKPAPPPPPRYTVTATFVEPTWMKLHIDGGPARQYTYHPGEKRVWKARRSIRFFIGNAGGIRLNVNGEDLPPLGPSGEVARLMIPDGLAGLRQRAAKPREAEKPPARAVAAEQQAPPAPAAQPAPAEETTPPRAAAPPQEDTSPAAGEQAAAPPRQPEEPPPASGGDGGM